MINNGNENTQTYQEEVVILIYHKKTYKKLQVNVYQVEGKINNQTLGVKGLNHHHYYQSVVIIVGYNKSIAILFALTFLWGTFYFTPKSNYM